MMLLSAPRDTLILRLLVVLYLVLRAGSYLDVLDLHATPDTHEYLAVAGISLADRDFYTSRRPFLMPLVAKLAGRDLETLVLVQLVVGTLSWLLLALTLRRVVTGRTRALLAAAFVLGFALSDHVHRWDFLAQTESLSLSLFALLLSASLRLLHRPGRAIACATVVTGALWVVTRDTNAYLLGMAAGGWLTVAVGRRRGGREMAVALLLLAAVGASLWSSNQGQRWRYPLHNIILQRVLPDAAARDFFVARGMPLPPALLKFQGGVAGQYQHELVRDPSLQPYEDWFQQHGISTYVDFVLSRPLDLATAPLLDVARVLFSDELRRAGVRGFRPPLGHALSRLFFPMSGLWLGLLVLAALGVVLWAARAGRIDETGAVMVTLLLLVYPAMMLSWHADAMEVGRHSLQAGVQLRLAAPLALILLLPGRARRGGAYLEEPVTALPSHPQARLVALVVGVALLFAALQAYRHGDGRYAEEIELDPAAITAAGGRAYQIALSLPAEAGNDAAHLDRSRWVLFDDQDKLGPGWYPPEQVMARGAGSYGHWGQTLTFSTRDGSDPRVNGRRYRLRRAR